jgi:uncharacterized membrane protein YvlD (DUF360 family)
MQSLRALLRFLIRLVVVWLVDAVSLLVTASILPGISITPTENAGPFVVAISAALILGIVNFFVRPIILMLARSLGFIIILLVGLFVNAIALMITANLIPELQISSWWYAFLGGLIFSVINTILTNIMTIDDDDSYYAGLIERKAKKDPIFKETAGEGQGVVMLEIDGLSYHHMQKAFAEGYMPNLKRLADEEGYRLWRVETGVPSMTSSCQAGILYGDNYDIPSFRWFDRDLNRFIVSQMDAGLLDKRYSKGQGLVRGGSSIGNMLNGDALKSIFVIATMKQASKEEARQRAQDIYLLMLNPYFFIRSIIMVFADAILEILQYARQVIRKVEPRLNRLHKGYPLMRAGLTAFLKDVAAYLISLDVIRGTPALYHTYAGYDEMAHHAGPWTTDAFHELKRFDRVIGRLLRIMREKAPRPYELIILSDHGQSFGHTFLQRYNLTLLDFIKSKLPHGASISGGIGSDDGSTSVMGMMTELDNIQDAGVGSSTGRGVVKQAGRLLQRGVEQRIETSPQSPTNVQLAFSGNLANVYFDLFDRRVLVSELNQAYPGMLDAVVQHEGVGFVIGFDDDKEPICFGKDGARNLATGDVTSTDPLLPYAIPYGAKEPTPDLLDLRARQLFRLASFPHAGDLIINSPVYPDGTVAAYEELIGNHGGMGGEQTDAFIFGPGDMHVPETSNSTDVFAILNARRGLTPAPAPVQAAEQLIDGWSRESMWAGLKHPSVWIGRAIRSVILDRDAYREVAQDANMNAPGLLLLLLTSLLAGYFFNPAQLWLETLFRVGMWFVGLILILIAGRLLGYRGLPGPVGRALAFAHCAYFIFLLGFIPGLENTARFIAIAVGFMAYWMGSAVSLKLSGWKALILPLIVFIVLVITLAVLPALYSGVVLTLQTLAADLGIIVSP